MPLDDPGFDPSVLRAFRARLLAGQAEWVLFAALRTVVREQNVRKTRGRQRTDATHGRAAVRGRGRLVRVAETLRHPLNERADVAPTWLRQLRPAEWFARSTRRMDDYRLPKGTIERAARAALIGADGRRVRTASAAPDAPTDVPTLPAVRIVRWVWLQPLYAPEAALNDTMRIRWRNEADVPRYPLMAR